VQDNTARCQGSAKRIIAAAVIQAKALFRALSPGRPSLVGFQIMENGLIAYEARRVTWLSQMARREPSSRPLPCAPGSLANQTDNNQ
jgi:hypothetical protein